MDEYRKLLILQYFNENTINYDFNEIVEKLGIGYERTAKLISMLIEDKMIIYKNYLLEITELGRQNIKKNDIYKLYENNIINANINISKKLDVNDIYIPKRFSKKI